MENDRVEGTTGRVLADYLLVSPGCSCHGGHKPSIEHRGGHFYGRQLCLATAWPRYGRSILTI